MFHKLNSDDIFNGTNCNLNTSERSILSYLFESYNQLLTFHCKSSHLHVTHLKTNRCTENGIWFIVRNLIISSVFYYTNNFSNIQNFHENKSF